MLLEYVVEEVSDIKEENKKDASKKVPVVDIAEYYEYECGSYCDGSEESGCPGHVTDIPVAISIDDVIFVIEGYEGGDYPNNREVDNVKNVIRRLQDALQRLSELES